MMKAAFYEGNRRIRVGESAPVAPGPEEVRIRVSHCGICGTDLHIFHGAMDKRVRTPAVLGHEMSGQIVEVGGAVEGWRAGDRVTVMPLDFGERPPPGHSHIADFMKFMGIDTPGAFQGSWTVPASTLFRLPDSLSFELGALVEPLAVACHDVRLGEVKPGENVVVIGGGPIGMLVALAARHAGGEVIVSEINPFRVEKAAELGLDAVNPAETDLNELVRERTGGVGADVVFEVSGSSGGARAMTALPRIRGRIVVVAVFAHKPEIDLFRFFWRELKLTGARVYEAQDYEQAIRIAASGELPLEKLVTETVPLEGLQDGFEKMARGGAAMKILIDVRA